MRRSSVSFCIDDSSLSHWFAYMYGHSNQGIRTFASETVEAATEVSAIYVRSDGLYAALAAKIPVDTRDFRCNYVRTNKTEWIWRSAAAVTISRTSGSA